MIIRMAKVDIIGPKDDLLTVLDLLRGRGVFQPDPQLIDVSEFAGEQRPTALILTEDEVCERGFFENLCDRIGELLGLLPQGNRRDGPLPPLPVINILDDLADQHLPKARAASEALAEKREELHELESDLRFWQALKPLLADLPESSGLELLGVTIRDPHHLDVLETLLQEKTGGRCHISTTSLADGTMIGLLATDSAMASALHQALTDERLPEMRLPESLAGLSLNGRIAALEQRTATCRADCAAQQQILDDLARQWRDIYHRAFVWLEERIALYRAAASAYATRQCFVIQGWMAADDVTGLQAAVGAATAGRTVLEPQAILEEDLDRVPVLLRNPGYFAPFELFSRLLPLPRYTSYDPTPFIGLFLPVLFGMILGDIGYGLVLGCLAALLVWKFPAGHLGSDLGKVLGVCAGYAILFGLLYGELFGTLGEELFNLHPLWFDRGKEILPMLVFALTVGVVHILFGMLLGIRSDLRRHYRREALVKLCMLLSILLTVLALVAWLKPQPWLATRPLLIGVGILLPVLIAAGGLLAPLELLKTMGNIVSYVRIMAIGLSSVLLAEVANRLGGMTGDLLLGILVAGLLHAFNLLLGVFAPTVHSLRLHYVEFFSKFLELGGRRFQPWEKRSP
ncbi:MAG: V-type ATPase 116kDa subunit family protein [Desulfuromonadales bacterium]|nr:V-type ATPase 116kDa subunit family protein [Desulfuromonadales bacterium]